MEGADEKRISEAKARRKFIIKAIQQKGFVTKEELERQNMSSNLRDDTAFFKDYSIPIEKTKDGFMSSDPRNRRLTYELRETLQLKEKSAVAHFAAALLTNTTAEELWKLCFVDQLRELHSQIAVDKVSRKTSDSHQEINDELKAIVEETMESVELNADVQLLAKNALQQLEYAIQDPASSSVSRRTKAGALIEFFKAFWSKPHRSVVIDSGTSTAEIAKVLARTASGRFERMRVLTNAPHIERILDKPDIPIDVIGLGGELRKDTVARTGYLAELCLKAWNFSVDLALIGTTGFRFDGANRPRSFTCDSEYEARTKLEFLSMSTLKGICFAGPKVNSSAASSFSFCDVSAEHVDFIITDGSISSTTRGKNALDWFRKQGIVVFVAPDVKVDKSDLEENESP